ncbi:MAG: pyridoxamine 5'-phosphate oxidase [Plesiomonas shigelloides]
MSLLNKLRCAMTMGQGLALPEHSPQENDQPYQLFQKWFHDAQDSGIILPESMTLATVSADGQPSARIVLLKDVTEDGFTFYTNYESRKGEELEQNPKVALVFHWNILQRQVRIEGTVERVSRETSDRYFQSRLRGSRIGAWASHQSHPLSSREELEQREAEFAKQFAGGDVPLPPYWGGYLVRPHAIEFWQGKASRLHDRIRFERVGENWQPQRLNP